VGKESNRLADGGEPSPDPDNHLIEYPMQDRKCRGCEERVSGRREWCSEACRKRADRAKRKRPRRTNT